MIPWLDARTYYQEKWGEPVGRVGVDGGFSCPNRGRRESPGCAFCSATGNRPQYQAQTGDLAEQVRKGTDFQFRRYGIRKFSLYFQAFSSTWAPVETLARVYDEGLAQGDFVELAVGTRPDCVPDPVVDLLASYRTVDREVWVELGLQSSCDATLLTVGRGHDAAAFSQAAARLRRAGLPFTAHVMYGLPGEGKTAFLDTVQFALAAGASGLKFHDLLLVPGTVLFQEWESGRLLPVDPEAYLDAVAEALVGLPPNIVVWRVCSDPENRRGVPSPGEKWPKNRFLNQLSAEVRKRRGL